MSANTILSGRDQIQKFLGRSWKTVRAWIDMGAPIAKLEGRWESDVEQLLEWRRSQIASSVDNSWKPDQGRNPPWRSPAGKAGRPPVC
ncbi:hypothetical protein SAMN02745216_03825 [Desulfatibacillum alkenivorans DSM 16219]|jgi:hypothetical protein|uniref:Uncharacterized protein n=1 Tax=Desulfatibacillum alkenivorans DSM 16219 TaxID=1121393 RepID=A0A1M6U5H7_9BACT|nr:hypothetical protein [Desulfatibacillum alkenivorans]SHK64525.1 hypothetical protein SAMN02745216_03825 [Desulfatibacillum alkenivorans DSM 16219]